MLKIREYQLKDRLDCLRIFNSNIPKYFANEERALFDKYLHAPPGKYWVMENDQGLIACAGYGVQDGNQGRLHWGMVMHGCHGEGYGTKFLKFRLHKLVEDPTVAYIGLDTSQHTWEFFHRFGFREFNVTPNGYGPGLHKHDMRWDLPIDPIERNKISLHLTD